MFKHHKNLKSGIDLNNIFSLYGLEHDKLLTIFLQKIILHLPYPIIKMFEKPVFIKYCIIGCFGVSLDFIVFSVLTNLFDMYYQYANIISVNCGIINNFFWNRTWTFSCKDQSLKRFISFYIVGLIGLFLSSLFLYFFVDIFKFNVLLGKTITIILVVLIQFNLNKYITFTKVSK
jgi:putative flippase GtrA